MKIFLLILLFGFSLFAFEVEVREANIANGKTTLLEFKNENSIKFKSVEFAKKKFQIFNHPFKKNKSYALIPFSYYESVGKKELKILYTQDGEKKFKPFSLNVIDGKYQKEEIHVSSSKVNPRSKEVKKRISKEYAQAMTIYGTVTPTSYITKPFIEPLHSVITSAFGKARVYNGSLKGYHSGTDYRAKVGTPVIASNDAKVALVENRFYSGGTVILNHGEGIYTCYFHMSKFSVQEGQIVKRGETLGLSGESGRVTGPHLHFSARINKVQVDPLQLIKLLNRELLENKGKTE